MENKLRTLIERKSFDVLSTEEKKEVLMLISEQEYRARYEAIQHSKAAFADELSHLQVNESTRMNALLALREKKKENRGSWSLFNYRIPAWSAVAAVVAVFFLMKGLNKTQNHDTTTVQVAKNDTIYIDRIIQDTITEYIVKTNLIERTGNPINRNKSIRQELINIDQKRMEWGNFQPSFDTNRRNRGKSMNEDVLAQKMLTITL